MQIDDVGDDPASSEAEPVGYTELLEQLKLPVGAWHSHGACRSS